MLGLSGSRPEFTPLYVVSGVAVVSGFLLVNIPDYSYPDYQEYNYKLKSKAHESDLATVTDTATPSGSAPKKGHAYPLLLTDDLKRPLITDGERTPSNAETATETEIETKTTAPAQTNLWRQVLKLLTTPLPRNCYTRYDSM